VNLGDVGLDGYKVALAIINFGLGIMMTFLTMSVKEVRDNIKERLQEQRAEIQAVREDLAQFKASAPHRYVLREDFIRSISVLDHKLDRMGSDIATLSQNVAKLVGSGGSREAP